VVERSEDNDETDFFTSYSRNMGSVGIGKKKNEEADLFISLFTKVIRDRVSEEYEICRYTPNRHIAYTRSE
jgi:hypothetical protein